MRELEILALQVFQVVVVSPHQLTAGLGLT